MGKTDDIVWLQFISIKKKNSEKKNRTRIKSEEKQIVPARHTKDRYKLVSYRYMWTPSSVNIQKALVCVCVHHLPSVISPSPSHTKRAPQRHFSLSWGQMLWQYYCTARMDGTVVQHCQSSWPQHVSARGRGRVARGVRRGWRGEAGCNARCPNGQSRPNKQRWPN